MAELPAMQVFWSPRTRLHEPGGEIWVGVPSPGDEVPERVDIILGALSEAGHAVVEASPHDEAALRAIHAGEFLAHLEGIHDAWRASGIPAEVGQDRVVPYAFPSPAFLDGLPAHVPVAVQARAGVYAFDTMTPVGPGTWAAARAAVDCALAAADAVLAGEDAAYALCRPPGHHATSAGYGGSCYLNNAAVAAQALRLGGHERVAVVDVDAHHGNGTASIFYSRGDVFYGSVHVDPGAGWFPHFVGFSDETGIGDGAGATRNVVLAPETGDDGWLAGVRDLAGAVRGHGATALVVSLGVDAAADDPNSPLRVSIDGYGRAGAMLRALALPTLIVQEGGYHLPTLGGLVRAFLEPF
jgi:acetoin utilization deacetylase AcuC-like enzyme